MLYKKQRKKTKKQQSHSAKLSISFRFLKDTSNHSGEPQYSFFKNLKKKKKNTNKNTTMIRTLANFFRKSEKFAKDSGIYKQRKDWNSGIQQKKGGICVVLI